MTPNTDIFPSPSEEGLLNLPFPAPAGNRLEWLQHEDQARLRVFYKPHAARRKDFSARNFSTRDLPVDAFRGIRIAQLPHAAVERVDYDPFLTKIVLRHASGAVNPIEVLTSATENLFALRSTLPLTLRIHPHRRFRLEDGCLHERFTARGESVHAFVCFQGNETNRVRRLEDGSVVLQFFGDEAVVFGAEDSPAQLARLRRQFAAPRFPDIRAANEAVLEEWTALAQPVLAAPDWQATADLNRRILLAEKRERREKGSFRIMRYFRKGVIPYNAIF